jgi:molybdopterin molybdotransferase
MEIDIQFTAAPIPGQLPSPPHGDLGAWVEFRGVVRGEENDQAIAALEYEAYQPMAEREMRGILQDLATRHPCLAARVVHRIGIVPVGEAAIYVGVAGRHRAEAFALLGEFMDRLKQDVPIWKRRTLPLPEQARPLAAHEPSADKPTTSPPGPAHSAADVLLLLRNLCRPMASERVALADAAGRVLREAVCAPEDQPPFDRSSVDGYAVRRDDLATQFRIVGEIRAGDWKPRRLQVGEAVRIATGAALPCDSLQVVMKEDARTEGGTLTVLRRATERNIRFRGEEARSGDELVSAGTVLQPGTLGLLASVGFVQPLVTRLPRVLHVATGNEIMSPDQAPGRGQIRDSNSTLVRAFLAQWGIAPEQRRAGEDEGAIQTAITDGRWQTADIDLLLISGGASVGEHDFTRRLLERLGFTMHVSKTTARPGKPLIVAQRAGTLAFGLPGNPLAHFVCLNLYVRAALEAWAGQRNPLCFEQGVLADDLPAGGHVRETFWPTHWQIQDGVAALRPLRWSSSGDLTALAAANALIRVPAGVRNLARGSRVEFGRTERIP